MIDATKREMLIQNQEALIIEIMYHKEIVVVLEDELEIIESEIAAL